MKLSGFSAAVSSLELLRMCFVFVVKIVKIVNRTEKQQNPTKTAGFCCERSSHIYREISFYKSRN